MAATITAQQLGELVKLENSKNTLLIVDCRSFLAFNKCHVRNAVNVRSNSIMRRRSRGAFTLENTITNCEKRSCFLDGGITRVVVYDEQGDIDTLSSKKTSNMVISALKDSAHETTTVIEYLTGGLQTFQAEWPEFCEGSMKTSSQNLLSTDASTSCSTPPSSITYYDQGSPVEILPYLYLGSAHHAAQKGQLKSLGITALINASSSCENHFEEDFTYKRIPVEDNGNADISSWFEDTISFINRQKESGGKTFVHCHAGVSRSATLCLAYLIARYQVSLNDAFKYVKNRRSVISPNFNFMGQLLKLESAVHGKDKCLLPSSGACMFDSNAVARMDAIAEFEHHDEAFASSSPVEETKPLASVTASKLYKRRANTAVKPLKMPARSLAEDKRCRTAPVISTNAFLFNDAKRTCNQEIGFRWNACRHPRTLTLSS